VPKWPTVTSQFKSLTSCFIRTRQILPHMGISTLCDYSRHFWIVEVAGGWILCSASGQLCPDARTERSVQVFGKTRTEIWIEQQALQRWYKVGTGRENGPIRRTDGRRWLSGSLSLSSLQSHSLMVSAIRHYLHHLFYLLSSRYRPSPNHYVFARVIRRHFRHCRN
jgi:hypothetical protein